MAKNKLKIKFNKKHQEIFRKLGIDVIYLFGSYAQGNVGPLSDVDIGVVFYDPIKYKDNTMDAYNKLYGIFTDVLPKEYLRRRFRIKEHEFDLVFLQFAPFDLQFNAIKDGKTVYKKSNKAKFNYQENVIKKHADLTYFYNMHHQAILASI